MDKLRALKFFCRVAETKSFAAAAYELDVVPSVLSKQIATLETNLRFKLFNRTTRRVSLTEHGTRYYDHCKRLLIDLDEAESLERGGMAKATGKIVAGIHPAINRVLMARIDEFLTKYPDVVVETTITSTPATMLDDKLDLLVTLADLPDFKLRGQNDRDHAPRARGIAGLSQETRRSARPGRSQEACLHRIGTARRPVLCTLDDEARLRGADHLCAGSYDQPPGRSYLRSLRFRRRDQPAGRSPHSSSNQTRRTRSGASGLVLEHAANSGRRPRQQEGAGKGEGSCRIPTLDHQGSR